MKKVSIYCDGGLGNRLCSLIGGLHLSYKLNYDFEIIWLQTRWCNCNFEDLFDNNINHINLSKNLDDYINENNITLILSHDKVGYSENIEYILQSDDIDKLDFSSHDKIFYRHNSIPTYINEHNSSKYLSTIKISDKILNQVKNFTEEHNINHNTIGLHIRRTDYHITTTDELYFNFVDFLKSRDVFVCSDEEEIEKKLKNKFSNVIVRNKLQYVQKFVDGPWRMNHLEGTDGLFNVKRDRQSVIDAFIDMLILSRTNIIFFNNIGSFYQLSNIYKHVNI